MSLVISRLALDHFRSWGSIVVDFAPSVNILLGRNGVGKTNIVESLEFLAMGSSKRSAANKYLVERGQTHAVIRANFQDDAPLGSGNTHTLAVTIPVRGAVRARDDSGKSRYFRDVAGTLKTVTFSPADQRLVAGDPAERRRFLDETVLLLHPDYYAQLQQFNHIARQRAAVLRRIRDHEEAAPGAVFDNGGKNSGMSGGGENDDGSGFVPSNFARIDDMAQLEAWTAQFIIAGVAITRRRAEAVAALSEPFRTIASTFASETGTVDIHYEPSFAEVLANFEDEAAARSHISQHFQRIYLGEVARTANLIGPHRDDFTVLLDGEPAKHFASNGELWTLALALRMAQFTLIIKSSQNYAADGRSDKPILILDDVFAQLDDSRRSKILDFANQQGQVFITAASSGDIPGFEKNSAAGNWNVIDVEALANAQWEAHQ